MTRPDLSGNSIGNGGCEHLATRHEFANLRELLLRSDELNDDFCIHDGGMAAIAASKVLTRLRVLNLAGQLIGGTGLEQNLVRRE